MIHTGHKEEFFGAESPRSLSKKKWRKREAVRWHSPISQGRRQIVKREDHNSIKIY